MVKLTGWQSILFPEEIGFRTQEFADGPLGIRGSLLKLPLPPPLAPAEPR